MSDGVFVNIQAEAVIARFTGMSAKMQDNVRRAIERLSIQLQAKVKDEKLSGDPLHVRSGTLRRSINRVVIEDGANTFAQVGTNVKYAHIHEYGYDGPEDVREYVRRSREQMSLARFRTNKLGEKIEIKGSYRKNGGGPGEIRVRAHTRQMHMPERSFLRSSLREMADDIRSEIRSAAREALL